MRQSTWIVGLIAMCACGPVWSQAQDPIQPLAAAIDRLALPLRTPQARFGYEFTGSVAGGTALTEPRFERGADGAAAPLVVRLDRHGAHAWALSVRSRWASFDMERTARRTVLAAVDHGIAFIGEGDLPEATDTLDPSGFVSRLVTSETIAQSYVTLLSAGQVGMLMQVFLAPHLEALGPDTPPTRWRVGDDVLVSVVGPAGPDASGSGSLVVSGTHDGARLGPLGGLRVTWHDEPTGVRVDTNGLRTQAVDRAELERMVFRALKRLLSVWLPSPAVLAPPTAATVPHGELRLVEGQPLLLLHGSPEAVGTARARLLGPQVRRTIDSTIYLVGAVETVRSGRWFPGTLDDAWARLSPHIPPRHQAELAALAAAAPDVSLLEAQRANVFPEYFHCSGFALFGEATNEGVLYHGRVLDYMTVIGLQQAAVTTVLRPDAGHAFLSAGYAGFTGCVSGMNEQQISIGEMGGGGRFDWDGVPMATLMRVALEECATLEQVKDLWRRSPRTCEYYYVFADGKTSEAVGVAATPGAVVFIQPGQSHPRLGDGITDAVVMSGGSRLGLLRKRVLEGYGTIDTQAAMDLMARPVSMSSNLHNVLFVPRRGEAWVANAGAGRPAAEMPYVRYHLPSLLAELGAPVAAP